MAKVKVEKKDFLKLEQEIRDFIEKQEDKFRLEDICNHFGWKFFANEHKKEIRLLDFVIRELLASNKLTFSYISGFYKKIQVFRKMKMEMRFDNTKIFDKIDFAKKLNRYFK